MSGKSTRWDLGLFVVFTLAIVLSARPAAAGPTLGLVADNANKSVTLFNADTDSVIGTVTLPSFGSAVGDVVISADKKVGYVTDFNSDVHILRIVTGDLPGLTLVTPGKNPIPISNKGEAVTLTPRGENPMVCDATSTAPIAIINPQKRIQVQTLSLGSDCNSIDACQNLGSTNKTVLATTTQNALQVRELEADASGFLRDTGRSLTLPGAINGSATNGPNNVACASYGESGIVITRVPHTITSFTIPNITQADVRTLSGTGQGSTVVINSAGTMAYNRQVDGTIDVYGFNTSTGALSASPLFTIAGPTQNNTFFGMDQMALNPAGTKLYVPRLGGIDIFNAVTGAPATIPSITITGSSTPDLTGIAIR